jgi:hypothetical protein
MIVDPELDPNDESNYDKIEGDQNIHEELDDKAIDEFSDFFSKYGTLPNWVKEHPDYIKRKKSDG